MATTTSFDEFLDAVGPENAEERLSLYECTQGEASTGLYSSTMNADGRLFIKAAHGEGLTLLLASEAAVKAFVRRLEQGLSEEGASFDSDAAFERAMSKDKS